MNRKRNNRLSAIASALLVTLVAGPVLAACNNSSSPSAMCGFIIGDGDSGHDSKVHKIVYPGQSTDHDSNSENVVYVPCNSRNFIINDGSVRSVNVDKKGQPILVGDRFTGSNAFTSSGAQITVYATAYWTLNQSDAAMRKFYDLCFKYGCATGDSSGGDANFSTPGWNGMLSENFGPSIDAAAFKEVQQIGDDIWRKHDASLYAKLSDAMSNDFATEMRVKTGYDTDLFCGSGNSGWKDPNKPGKDEFTCTNVRIHVDSVVVSDPTLVTQANQSVSADQASATNKAIVAAAIEKYGPDAQYWLALQDTLSKCSAATTCIVNIGGSSPGVTTGIPVIPTSASSGDTIATTTTTPGG